MLINYLENVTVLTISKNRSRGLRLKLQFLQVCTFKWCFSLICPHPTGDICIIIHPYIQVGSYDYIWQRVEFLFIFFIICKGLVIKRGGAGANGGKPWPSPTPLTTPFIDYPIYTCINVYMSPVSFCIKISYPPPICINPLPLNNDDPLKMWNIQVNAWLCCKK